MKDTVYKVQKLIVKDFKNIENLDIDFNGKSVFLIGENAQGKSSVIQAIWLALSRMKAPTQPIMEGKDEASIIVIIGTDDKQYKVERTFHEDGTESLEITSPDGFKTSKIANLAALVGDINFDIMKFVSLCNTVPGRREQVKMIRAFLSDELNAEIDKLDAQKKQLDEERTEINKDITKLKAKIVADKFSEDELATYKEPIVVADLMTEMKEAQDFNTKIDAAERSKTDAEGRVKELNEKLEEVAQKEITDLKSQEQSVVDISQKEIDDLAALEQKYNEDRAKIQANTEKALKQAETDRDTIKKEAEEKLKKITAELLTTEEKLKGYTDELAGVTRKEVEPIQLKITNSEAHNTKHNEIKEQAAFVKEMADKKTQYENRKAQLDEIAEKRQALIASAKLPVEELGFTDDHLLYKGVPLEEEAQSTSELMEIGMKLAIAKAPVTRIVQIARAESLGTKRLETMKQIGFKADFQMFYEEVKRDQEELIVKFIEEKE